MLAIVIWRYRNTVDEFPRVYPILDGATLTRRSCSPLRTATGLLAGGARILQLRHKGHWTREMFDEAAEIARLCRESNAIFVVNDRADFALLLEAGLHIGQNDLTPTESRRLLGPDLAIGFSTHNAEQLIAASGEPVDYIALGPIYETVSKENPDPVVGVDQLRSWRKLVPQPLVAIGGIRRENALAVFDAGADSVAIIGDLLPDVCTEQSIRERMEEWQQLTRK